MDLILEDCKLNDNMCEFYLTEFSRTNQSESRLKVDTLDARFLAAMPEIVEADEQHPSPSLSNIFIYRHPTAQNITCANVQLNH